MASEWKQVTFADVIELISGGTPKTNVPEYWGGPIPWLSVTDFNTGYRWVGKAEKMITDLGLAESATTILNRGDIIISARGTVGVVAQLSKPMAFNQSCYGIRGRQGIAETTFVYYALRHAVSQMQQVAHGGVFSTITRDTFKIIELLLPTLSEQRSIAHILGTLDDKIELNRKMNETLEAMSRVIFKAWFVDFEPIRAKMEGRWQRGQSLPGLPAHLYDLFPDRLVDSELGEIPEGWSAKPFSELLIESNERVGIEEAPEYSSTNEGLQLRSDRFKKKLSGSSSNNKIIRRGYLIFGLSRKILNFGIMYDPVGSVSAAYKVFRIIEKEIDPDYIGQIMRIKSNYFFNAVSSSSREGQSISTNALGELLIVQTSPVIRHAFSRITSSIRAKSRALLKESENLANIRDTLLSKLISGEIRVRITSEYSSHTF